MKKTDEDRTREEIREQLSSRHSDYYPRRPLSNYTSVDYQIHRSSRRQTKIDDENRYPPVILPGERTSLHMRSSTLPQYVSNPDIIDNNRKQQILNKPSTASFVPKTNKLRNAKSYNELDQTNKSLSFSPKGKTNHDVNQIKNREIYFSESPLTVRSLQSQTSIVNSQNGAQFSPSHKTPLWKRFKKLILPSKRKKGKKNLSSQIPTLILNELTDNEGSETIHDGLMDRAFQNPIKVNELRTWTISKIFPEREIQVEYETLPTEPLHPKTVAMRPENKMKNRFNAIEPYDHSRVILNPLPNDPTSDYINASYIDGFQAHKLYIAAQAPTDVSVFDFFRMIWQLRIQSIIMLTRLFEDGKHKCLQYWPDEGEKQINYFKIRIESEEKFAFYIIRRLSILNQLEPSDVLILKQYHFLSWPDHDCLSFPTPLLEFRKRFRNEFTASSPILVHCSAGVGRSGTFIALDALLEALKSHDTIDILEFTYRMRQNRVHMIQTVDQYVFLYRAIVEAILTMNTHISLREFMITRKLCMDLKDQYKLLEQLQQTISFSYSAALHPTNRNKNRFETILAPDNTRPYLITQVDQSTDYINAVFVNSYRQASNYIATQYPLPHTIIDFWRLVYDHNITIIMLMEPIIRDPKNIPYWPTTVLQNVLYRPFEIVLVSQKEDEYLVERVFEVAYSNRYSIANERTKLVRQFQVKDSSRLLPVVKRFLKEMRTRSEQNVILQCLNGVKWSGYFAALCNSIDKMKVEQIMDPFEIVRLLRASREQFIDQNQYENLFISMIDYAQQYLSVGIPSNRLADTSLYINTSKGHHQSVSNKR